MHIIFQKNKKLIEFNKIIKKRKAINYDCSIFCFIHQNLDGIWSCIWLYYESNNYFFWFCILRHICSNCSLFYSVSIWAVVTWPPFFWSSKLGTDSICYAMNLSAWWSIDRVVICWIRFSWELHFWTLVPPSWILKVILAQALISQQMRSPLWCGSTTSLEPW